MDDLVKQLVQTLRYRGQTLSLAESCTGGLLSAQLVKNAGVSDVFLGGVVAYANHLKIRVLNVSPHLIGSVGAVSREVALAMAHGAKSLTNSTWAVSITGIAGPSGGSDRKPIGTVCFGIVGPGFEKTTQQHFSGNRTDIQNSSTEFAARWLLENL